MNYKYFIPFIAILFLATCTALRAEAIEDYRLAFQDYRQGQYAQAVSAFQKVIQENPGSWQAYQGLGSAFKKTGDRQGALQAFKKCLELNPNNPQVKSAMDGLMAEHPPGPSALPPDQQPFFDDFNSIDPSVWSFGNFTFATADSYQKPSQVTASNSIVSIRAERAAAPIKGRNFLTGELDSKRLFTHGRFSARLKNQLVPGMDNCFFLMSPWQAKGWNHQELDFEFLGKDPNRVQVNVHKYIDGQGNIKNGGQLPKMIDLGFDSNQAFHIYTIEWLKDRINFYVDDKQVWTETKNLPDQDLNLRLSNFVVNQENGWGPGWAGRFDPQSLPSSVQFDWVKYEPAP